MLDKTDWGKVKLHCHSGLMVDLVYKGTPGFFDKGYKLVNVLIYQIKAKPSARQ